MRKFKIMVLAALFTLAFALNVSAKTDPHRAAVEKLLSLTNQDQLINQALDQVKQLTLKQFQQFLPSETTPGQQAIIEKHYNKMFEVVKAEMSWSKMKEDFIQIYISNFTEKEINEVIAFYETPIGKKFIEKTPVIMQQSTEISQKYTLNMMPKLQKIAEELVAELSKGVEDKK